MEGTTIRTARIALGGVAHKPWRVPDAERCSRASGKRGQLQTRCRRVSLGAPGYAHNAFKIELAKRAIVRALVQAVKMEGDGDRHLIGRAQNRVDGPAKSRALPGTRPT